MALLCPHCRATIPLEDVNVSTDLALCRACGNTFAYASLVDAANPSGADMSTPPEGAWFQNTGSAFRLGATTRSPAAFFIIPFTCVWAGGSLGGIYGSQITKGHFNPVESLFGLPFLLGSLLLLAMCAMTVGGKIELSREGDCFSVFTGVGSLGWTRRYAWSEFNVVREGLNFGGWNMTWNQFRPGISLEGKSRITFGNMWSETRRYFVLSALRSLLGNQSRSAAFVARR